MKRLLVFGLAVAAMAVPGQAFAADGVTLSGTATVQGDTVRLVSDFSDTGDRERLRRDRLPRPERGDAGDADDARRRVQRDRRQLRRRIAAVPAHHRRQERVRLPRPVAELQHVRREHVDRDREPGRDERSVPRRHVAAHLRHAVHDLGRGCGGARLAADHGHQPGGRRRLVAGGQGADRPRPHRADQRQDVHHATRTRREIQPGQAVQGRADAHGYRGVQRALGHERRTPATPTASASRRWRTRATPA